MRIGHLGLRAQIVLSLAALLLVVFSFTAMAVLWVLRESLQAQSRELAEGAARTVLVQLAAEARQAPSEQALLRLLSDARGRAWITCVGLFDGLGEPVAFRGGEGDTPDRIGIDTRRPRPFTFVRRRPGMGQELVLIEPLGGGRGSIAAVVGTAPSGAMVSRVARIVLAYLISSGLLLLGFGYVALTRLIVRPLETLTVATEKVAEGRLDTKIPVRGGWEIAAAAKAFNDMTRRLRDQQESLAQKVDELERTADELRLAQDQLVRSAKLASVGSLAAGVAHEVGNPVSAILGLSEVLIDGDIDEQEAQDYLERIKKEAERVNRIIRDLLEYSRPTPAGAEEISIVGDAVDAAVGLLSPQKAYRELDIQILADDDVPPVLLGHDELTQILVNLMMNAADSVGGEGEVRVRVTRHGTIPSPAGGSRPAVRVSVSDSGPGVPEELLPHIFEPFYTTKDPGSGTGLGLALCEGIVSRAGGTLSAENLPRGGFMLSLILPADEPEED